MGRSLLKAMLCLAVMALAGGVTLWGQEVPADEGALPIDPSLEVQFEGAPWGGAAAGAGPQPAAPPDAPSTLRETEPVVGDTSSSRPAVAQPDYLGVPVVRPAAVTPSQKFHWGPALRQSFLFLLIEHGFRLGTQDYTRQRTVEGPFFQDWFDSVGGIKGWDDGDHYSANYIGHPLQGAIASYIQIQNDPGGMHREFGSDPGYWKSRMRAMAWSAAYSAQFELGPVGEATIGNVGQKEGTGGAVDLVVTPVVGLGLTVTEDALDKYVIRGLERRSQSRNLRALARSLLNPSRSFANLLRRKAPWHRDTRDGVAVAGEFTPPAEPRPAAAAASPAETAAKPAESCDAACP